MAIYPQDGTVIADHTFAIMDRAPWVTRDQVKAAEIFREFLFTKEQQALLVGYGLRPADKTLKLGPPIDVASGANPADRSCVAPTRRRTWLRSRCRKFW